MDTTAIRRIVSEWCLTVYFATHNVGSIESHGHSSDIYRLITSWCDVDALEPVAKGLRRTRNGILYDVKRDCFVYSACNAFVLFNFAPVFAPGLAEYVDVSPNVDFVYEDSLPRDHLDALEHIGAISPRIEVPNWMTFR